MLVNIGQVGMFIAGGTNNRILDNVVYGEQRPGSNVGIYVADFSDGPCSGHTVSGNRPVPQRRWSPQRLLAGSGCGTVTSSGTDWVAPLILSNLRVAL